MVLEPCDELDNRPGFSTVRPPTASNKWMNYDSRLFSMLKVKSCRSLVVAQKARCKTITSFPASSSEPSFINLDNLTVHVQRSNEHPSIQWRSRCRRRRQASRKAHAAMRWFPSTASSSGQAAFASYSSGIFKMRACYHYRML